MGKIKKGRLDRVVVAGQMPPPIGGQNINTKRFFELLSALPDIEVAHLKFAFTKDWTALRRASLGKVVELFRVVGRILRLRLRGRIDVLIYPSGGPHTVPIIRDLLLLPLLSLVSSRLVVHFQAAGLAEKLDRSGRWFRWLCRLIYSRCCGEAIVLSNYGRRDAVAVGISFVTVIPNAVEDLVGSAFARDIADKPRILNVGHLCADKGTPQLIAAFGKIAQSDSSVELILVGEPLSPYSEETLISDIESTGVADSITWRGVLQGSALAEAYREAELFVFASVAPYESFGLVTIEAMQWSLPLVITDWRANLEVCGSNFGGVVAEAPATDLKGSLEGALRVAIEASSNWGEWGGRNREIFEEKYTIDRLRQNLLDLVGAPEN